MATNTNYKGDIEVISGLTPKNGRDFPIVEAHDVLATGTTRLDTYIANTGTSIKTYVDNAISDAASTASTAASGIRSDLGNKNDAANASGSAFARIASITATIGSSSSSGTIRNDISTLSAKLGAQDAAAATGTSASAFARIKNLETSVGTSSDSASATGTVYARIAKNAADIATINNTIGTNSGTTLTGRLTSIETTIGTTDQAASASGSLYQRILQNKNDIATLNSNLATTNSNVSAETSARTTADTALSGRITTLESTTAGLGGGMVATSTAKTTSASAADKAKVWIYSGTTTSGGWTNGHWYYWNSSAWVDGGAVGGTEIDTQPYVLTGEAGTTYTGTAGKAADSAQVGAALSSLSSDLMSLEESNPILNDVNYLTKVVIDENDKIVEALTDDGVYEHHLKHVFDGGLETSSLSGITKSTTMDNDNNSYLAAYTDENNTLLMGIGDADGKVNIPNGLHTGDISYSSGETTSNDTISSGFSLIITDSNDKMLLGVDATDGSLKVPGGINTTDITTTTFSTTGNDTVDATYSYLMADKNNNLIFGLRQDGTSTMPILPDEITKHYDENSDADASHMQIMADTNGIMYESIEPDGEHTFHNTVKFINNINFTKESINSVYDAMKQNGLNISPSDYSNAEYLHIPEPRLAYINFSGIAAFPTSKTDDMKAWMQFNDGRGNYFNKRVILNCQGYGSMAWPKKNFKFDMYNSENSDGSWNDDDTFMLKIGDWVPRDSFHIKAYWDDAFRGFGAIAYKFMDQIMATRPFNENRMWKKALLGDSGIYDRMPYSNVTFATGNPDNQFVGEYFTDFASEKDGVYTNNCTLNFDNGARCYPDGFPCIVTLNGEFYGIYAFQLPKHRDNMMQDKKTAEHIHLDGFINAATTLNGYVAWNQTDTNGNYLEWAEIRNPKSLILMDGSKYDGDNPKEIIDSTSSYYDSSNKDHKRSAKVKQYITNLSNIMPAINEAHEQQKAGTITEDQFRELFETYFDPDNWIDYIIFSDIVCNVDGWSNNWQWSTWDGVKWYVNPYDVDCVFGKYMRSDFITNMANGHLDRMNTKSYPSAFIFRYYNDRLEARYKELRDKGIIDADNIIKLLEDWVHRIGADNYEREFEKWPAGEHFGGGSSIVFVASIPGENIFRVYKWLVANIQTYDSVYHYTAN